MQRPLFLSAARRKTETELCTHELGDLGVELGEQEQVLVDHLVGAVLVEEGVALGADDALGRLAIPLPGSLCGLRVDQRVNVVHQHAELLRSLDLPQRRELLVGDVHVQVEVGGGEVARRVARRPDVVGDRLHSLQLACGHTELHNGAARRALVVRRAGGDRGGGSRQRRGEGELEHRDWRGQSSAGQRRESSVGRLPTTATMDRRRRRRSSPSLVPIAR